MTVLVREQQREAPAAAHGVEGGGAAAKGDTLLDLRVSVANMWADHAAGGGSNPPRRWGDYPHPPTLNPAPESPNPKP